MKRSYITHATEKYLSVAHSFATSIREFSDIPVVDTDHECGIVHPTQYGDHLESYNNGYYEYNKDLIFSPLNIIFIEDFLPLFETPISKNYTYI
jgi:hypothetical protein